jgi:hypothetical protein
MEIQELAEIVIDRLDKLETKVDKATQALTLQSASTKQAKERIKNLENRVDPLVKQSDKMKGAFWVMGGLITALEVWHKFWP